MTPRNVKLRLGVVSTAIITPVVFDPDEAITDRAPGGAAAILATMTMVQFVVPTSALATLISRVVVPFHMSAGWLALGPEAAVFTG
jgi:hypothetical protein